MLADLIFMKDEQFTVKEESLMETLNMSFFERIDEEHHYSPSHIRFVTRLIEVINFFNHFSIIVKHEIGRHLNSNKIFNS